MEESVYVKLYILQMDYLFFPGGDEVRNCIEDTEESRCISEDKDGVLHKTCYCNTERCNTASTPVHLDYLLFLIIAAPLFLRVR